MTELFKAGADAGNNGLKLWVSDADPITIPSIYSDYMRPKTAIMDMEDIAPDELIDNLDVTINSKALPINNGRYIVGNKVLTERVTNPAELELRSDKSQDEIPVITTLSGLAAHAMRLNPNKDSIEVNYDLSVALPVNGISKEAVQRNEARYIGTHEVIFHHPSERDVTVTIKIEFCKCIPEGAAAAWGIVFDEKGKVTKRKVEIGDRLEEVTFKDKTLLHFDIGAGTTELVVTEGIKYQPTQSRGLEYGVKKTIADIIQRWNRDYPNKTIDSSTEFNEIYFDPEHPRHNDLVNDSQAGLNNLARTISIEIINEIDGLKDDPFVFIYGGGAAIIKTQLQQILKKKGRMANVIFLNDPMYINARGLLVYTSSPRFTQLKEKALGVADGKTDK